ncbi:glycine cleavage system, H protein [Secundilactobacillus pentosiphilus]|uniref:Glycine cleavage system, H protein n=1 Tax=Secundilactobacillus pentosiphilus TaxID=1714682 RepID=A0A1Z5INH3_9LACO|nr:glycine cleavage system protein H [Secundilactobacillus pentosiphilus]GAX03300.1 glycine cleavage system, H protein [Secundilactobacillus pentosiphilus]
MAFWTKLICSIKHLFSKKAAQFEPAERDGVWYQEIKPGIVRVGIADQAYEDLGDITFMDFSSPTDQLELDDDLLEMEGAKAVETLKSPVKGTIIARNNELLKQSDALAKHSTQDNWLVDVKTA